MNDLGFGRGFDRRGGRGTPFLVPPLFCQRGVTLAELLVVIAVLGVLATIGFTLMTSSQNDAAAKGAARRIACDIAFAQADAVARRAPRTVRFLLDEEAYRVNSEGETIEHPLSKLPYRVDLAQLYAGTGINLREASFGGADSLTFDEDGLCSAGGRVYINVDENIWSVSVADQTGHITVTEGS